MCIRDRPAVPTPDDQPTQAHDPEPSVKEVDEATAAVEERWSNESSPASQHANPDAAEPVGSSMLLAAAEENPEESTEVSEDRPGLISSLEAVGILAQLAPHAAQEEDPSNDEAEESEPLSAAPSDPEEPDGQREGLRFQIMLRKGDDDSSVNIAWHYPPGNPRDNSAWVGLYHATRWETVQLPCPRPDLKGRIGYKYLSHNACHGELNFAIQAKSHIPDGPYVFVLHTYQDIPVATSPKVHLVDHIITHLEPAECGRSSKWEAPTGIRDRRRVDCPIVQFDQPPSLLKHEKSERSEQARQEKKRKAPKPEKVEKTEKIAYNATHLGQPVNTDLSEAGFVDGSGVRRCGAIGARGPCGRRWGTCPYHPMIPSGGGNAKRARSNPVQEPVLKKRPKVDKMERIMLSPANINANKIGLGEADSPGDSPRFSMLGIHKESLAGAISVELEAVEPDEWAALTPTTRAALPKNRPPMLELPGTHAQEADHAVPRTPGQVSSGHRSELHRLAYAGDNEKITALLAAAAPEMLQGQLDAQQEHGFTALIDATSNEDHEVSGATVAILLEKGATVDIADLEGFTAAHWAAACNNLPALQQLITASEQLVNAESDTGETPLFRAARLGHARCVRLLLERGANPVHANHNLETVLEIAGVWESKLSVKKRCEIRKVVYEKVPQFRTLVVHHTDFLGHITRDGHQEAPQRVIAILDTLKQELNPNGLFEGWELELSDDFPVVEMTTVAKAHSQAYIDLVNQVHDSLSDAGTAPVPFTPLVQRSLKIPVTQLKENEYSDTSFSHGSRLAALRAAGAVVYAIDKVIKGDNRGAFCVVRPPGHHAGVNGLIDGGVSCGFCIFNSVAIGAIHALESHKMKRVAIIDFDVHHGNGTENIIMERMKHFHKSNSIFFCSTHLYEVTPQYEFYPGSGESDNLRHNVINCPIQPLWNFRRESSRGGNSTYAKPKSPNGAGEKAGRGHFRNQMLKRVLPSLRAYAPDLIIISAGFDGAERDLGCRRVDTDPATACHGLDLLPQDYAWACLLYTSDAADEEDSVDLGGRRIIKKKKSRNRWLLCMRETKTD
eukprot:TRINITY_DN11870_c0_g1_i2.p1 TRINITY_DN11870_c0_g1~~TRINITY_DN11870_c0_g1_i2.p1  ORF type:complete len:1069 (+),score=245.15 TRINITY_DN11870_c0_g1_i2:82-3288(+)